MHVVATTMILLSILVPTRTWFTPSQPVTVKVTPPGVITLILTDFLGNNQEPAAEAKISSEKIVDVEALFPALKQTGTYILYSVPPGRTRFASEGTPLVIDVRADNRKNAPPGRMVTKVEPLRYAEIATDAGVIRACFFYDITPNTVAAFCKLADEGFYDGMPFSRVLPDFIIQTGDPRGDGSGGPGYSIDAEFSDRPLYEGTLAMARMTDPNEPKLPPRSEFANSAGSQFFICVNYDNTKQLDGRYTAFARIVDGFNVLRTIAKSPLADAKLGRPQQPVIIRKLTIKPVTTGDNPYEKLQLGRPDVVGATTQPKAKP
jgi:cyclophilin family peptidyl-prolyl cis-trans isomerase